jgi:hypothetical protein
VRYEVAEILSTWHLGPVRYWERDHHFNRHYWRVQRSDFGVNELYHDAVSGAWVLDVVQA